jgi:predicted small lipoprotein YifL
MKKIYLAIIGLTLICILSGCGLLYFQSSTDKNEPEIKQEQETAKAEASFSGITNVFGFADESGTKLITLPDENGAIISSPESYDIAIGNSGEIINIKYARTQQANENDNYRQTADNFDNMRGCVYEAADGGLIKNKTYLLSSSTVISQDMMIKLKSTKSKNSNLRYYKLVDTDTVIKVENLKNRKIIDSSLLAETEDGAQICLFVFDRLGDDMLASLAYIKGDQISLKDYPAVYNELSTWRVDAGDRPGLFEVLFLINSDKGLLLGISWQAPEGENVFILNAVNGAFEDTNLSCGRYWAP